MSMERRVDLELSIPRGMPGFPGAGAGGVRRDASDADMHAFQHALAQEGEDEAQARQQRKAADAPRPLGLFGAPLSSAVAAQTAAPEGLTQDLCAAAGRLLVSGGHQGRREVRIDLKDEVLPGVTVSVYEDEGRVVAAFTCASEPSREKLCACANALARELAQSLKRLALVRVTTDDPEDPCLFEAAAAP